MIGNMIGRNLFVVILCLIILQDIKYVVIVVFLQNPKTTKFVRETFNVPSISSHRPVLNCSDESFYETNCNEYKNERKSTPYLRFTNVQIYHLIFKYFYE